MLCEFFLRSEVLIVPSSRQAGGRRKEREDSCRREKALKTKRGGCAFPLSPEKPPKKKFGRRAYSVQHVILLLECIQSLRQSCGTGGRNRRRGVRRLHPFDRGSSYTAVQRRRSECQSPPIHLLGMIRPHSGETVHLLTRRNGPKIHWVCRPGGGGREMERRRPAIGEKRRQSQW